MLDGVMLLWFLLTAASLCCSSRSTSAARRNLRCSNGVRAADRVYRRGRCVSLRARLPRATARSARALRRCALAPSAGIDDALRAPATVSASSRARCSASVFGLTGLAEVVLEYILGFAFGWTIFQALFMRDMAGGSYLRALTGTFMSELLSMNLLMAGMVPTVMALKARIAVRRRSDDAELLVRDVDGASGRLYRRLSDELVAGGPPSQARHDDGASPSAAAMRRRRARRAWTWSRNPRLPCAWMAARSRGLRCR